MKQTALSALALVLGLTAFTGCSDDESTVNTPAAQSGRVLAIHASPDAPGVDIRAHQAQGD